MLIEDIIKSFLLNAKNIVIIAISSNSSKDSFKVMKFLKENRHNVILINSQALDDKIL